MRTQPKESDLEIQNLYERYAPLVHSRCLRFLKSDDEAWDATQEVFMKLIESLSSIQKKDSIYSWLLSTSTNYCFSQLRKKKSISFEEEVHSSDSSGLPQDRWMLVREVMKHFLNPWDEKIREVITYTYFDGYKQEEIAELTGMGESTIRRHLTTFKRKSAASGLKLEDLL
jgi:RNA polymerase sigma factor (sigma-70 family)